MPCIPVPNGILCVGNEPVTKLPRPNDGIMSEKDKPEFDCLPNMAYARKTFYDFLDKNRLWAQPGVNAYEMMEVIVDAAAWAFRGERRPTLEDVCTLIRLTEHLDEHPADYNGPCLCVECREDAGR